MDNKPLFVLYSIVAITIALSFSSIDAQTNDTSTNGNITSATESMGETMANQSSTVVDNATKSMGETMANQSTVVGNVSESIVTRLANAASSETESIVNSTTNAVGNMTQGLSTNSTM